MIEYAQIDTEEQLEPVLEMCYRILGDRLREAPQYSREAWRERLGRYSRLLTYAHDNGRVVAAVLGRPENADSLVMGFVACEEGYRMKGITRELAARFEAGADAMGFKYITLGAAPEAEGFYEKLGYSCIVVMDGQKIYQKKAPFVIA